jgi:phosphoribosylanthranilate isomerase
VTRVKICGITNLEDALAAVEYGADAVGFVLYRQSPRYTEPSRVREIIRQLPPYVTTVGLFVDAQESEIRSTVEECGIDLIQFQGNEPPDLCHQFSQRAIKAIHVRDRESLVSLSRYRVRALLLDTYQEGEYGGTGKRFDWDLAVAAKVAAGRIILAGGLTPENVREAVCKVHPYGVDVSSGVEGRVKGKKDHEKIRRFIEAAKGLG